MNDLKLLAALQSSESEREAFQQIYEKYAGLVLHILRQYRISEAQCEELLYEFFLRIFQHRMNAVNGQRFKWWLCTTVRNTCVDWLRRNSKDLVIKTSVTMNVEPPVLNPQMVHNVQCLAVEEILETIAMENKDDSLRLYYVEGQRDRDIAASKGLSVPEVTANLIKLRRIFKTKLQKHIQ